MNVHSTNEKGGWSVDAVWLFHKKEYVISCSVKNDLLKVAVEEQLTADRWKAQFEAKHIEELTRKTGNFKKFPIFLNMLKSAITRGSESVCLDLLTYEDLEHMWDRKLGPVSRRGGLHSPSSSSKAQAKRYLILTYNVEFDRIHYPLALTYCGQPDPQILQEIIRKLQAELDSTRKQALQDYKSSTVIQLQKENALLLQEKEQLEEELMTVKHEVFSFKENDTSKEINVLKKVVKNLEEEVLKEHSKYQKNINKKNEELKDLMQEVEELRLSERVLRARLKNLTNELSICKRGPRITSTSKKSSYQRKRTSSTEKGFVRGRKLSAESRPGRMRLRTPSPYGSGRRGRFDPTAYVEEKRKQHLLLARGRHEKPKVSLRPVRSRSSSLEMPRPPLRRTLSGSTEKSPRSQFNRRIFSRDPSPNSKNILRSRDSSPEGAKRKTQVYTQSSRSRDYSVECPRRPLHTLPCSRDSSIERTGTQNRRKLESPHDEPYHVGKENQFKASKHSQEISEIDARLMALQDFMKRSLESAKIHK